MTQKFSWSDKSAWPVTDSKNVFLADAVQMVGRAKYGEKWTGLEPDLGIRPPVIPPLPPAKRAEAPPRSLASPHLAAAPARAPVLRDDPDAHVWAWRIYAARCSEEKRAEHSLRLNGVVEWIAERGRGGDILTVGRFVNWTEHFPLPVTVWNAEPLWLKRFSECQFPYRSSPTHHPVPTYLFLERGGLERCIGTLEHSASAVSQVELATFSPLLQFAVALARKWKADVNWAPLKIDALKFEVQREWKAAHGTELNKTPAEYIARIIKFPE